MSDLIRIECDGLSWFDLCHPYCGPGYVGVESMSCANTTTPMIPSSFVGVARCERDVCSGSPPAPLTGYEPWGSNCTGMLYQERCTTSCSDGYTDLGVPVQLECLASTAWPVSGPVQYGWASSSGTCTELSCEAGSVPYWWGVVDSSSCIGTASRASCSPVCDESYDLVEPINCTKGQFDPIPLVCIPSEHSEALEYDVGVLLLPMAIATNEIGSSSWLTADWVSSDEIHAAIISLLANTLGLLPGQVFVSGVIGLNSDSSYVIPAARRLTTQQGVFFNAVLQPYPIDNLTALEARTSDLGGGNFTDQLAAALQRAAVSPPAGLALATLVTWPTEHASFTLPMARWVARTEWSACSNLCGVGAQTRIVQCVGAWDSNATDLCDANAAPSFTMESFMPDSKPCEQYIQCPYDWSCPSGPDPITGEGCESQASAVAIGLAVAFLCCACVLCQCARRNKEALQEKVDKMLGFEKRNIQWTRDEDRDRTHGSATLTPKGGRGVPIGPVDLDFSGTVDFELQMTVTTTASDALLVGKVYRWSDPSHQRNGAKALVIKQGTLAWQVGEHYIHGKMFIQRSEQRHRFRFLTAEKWTSTSSGSTASWTAGDSALSRTARTPASSAARRAPRETARSTSCTLTLTGCAELASRCPTWRDLRRSYLRRRYRQPHLERAPVDAGRQPHGLVLFRSENRQQGSDWREDEKVVLRISGRPKFGPALPQWAVGGVLVEDNTVMAASQDHRYQGHNVLRRCPEFRRALLRHLRGSGRADRSERGPRGSARALDGN
ncbi:unnamed protein product [Prorocentrum cordatum]|nr:unnamed protein product [Polarella glacialis]